MRNFGLRSELKVLALAELRLLKLGLLALVAPHLKVPDAPAVGRGILRFVLDGELLVGSFEHLLFRQVRLAG